MVQESHVGEAVSTPSDHHRRRVDQGRASRRSFGREVRHAHVSEGYAGGGYRTGSPQPRFRHRAAAADRKGAAAKERSAEGREAFEKEALAVNGPYHGAVAGSRPRRSE